MRDISDLVKKQKDVPRKDETNEEMTRRLYLEDVARMRDFRPDEERMRWPSPIRPRWKN